MIIKVKLEVSEEIIENVKRVFNFVGETRGVRFVVDDNNPDIIYTSTPTNGVTTLNHNPSYYNTSANFEYAHKNKKHLWVPKGDEENIDYIGTIYRFLFFIEEKGLNKSYKKGFTSFFSTELKAEHRKVKKIPIADYNSLYCLQDINQSYQTPKIWSGGNKITVALTHDVDGPLASNRKEIVKSALKFVLRRKKKFLWQFFEGVKALLSGKRGALWRFTEWAEKEAEFGGKSVFYVYCGQNYYPIHINDPAYKVDTTKKWGVLKELEDMGCEIGLQPGINAKIAEASFSSEKKFLENYSVAVTGTRHHYWELNWQNPYETLAMHANVGLKYDASIGWKDATGYRIGTAIPHSTVGVEKHHVIVPTTIIDSHLFDYQAFNHKKCMEETLEHIKHIMAVDGVLVLDWHERTFEDTPMYKGQSNFYWDILKYLQENMEVNYLLPTEISEKVTANSKKFGLEK